jgi:unsaturated chondroitin disaccharide hydrolase
MVSRRLQSIIARKIDISSNLKHFPNITENSKWQTTQDGDWTGGFWVGLLWSCYQLTRDEKYLRWAYQWLKRLETRKQDKTFDLGFLFYPSFVSGYQITKDEDLKKIALEAADTLSGLFHQKAGFIYNEVEFDGRRIGRTDIDAIAELSLLWWAHRETGDIRYFQPAYKHCLTTIERLVRKDYSTIHVLDFDLESGQTIRKITVQGYSNESCWSRGQAWAIYGFASAYQACKEKKFLEVAEGLADYFILNLPKDYVPYWDFDDPAIPHSVRDSSAAAIACSGLFTMSTLNQGRRFKEAAVKILDALTTNYLAEDSDGILKHGCYHKPDNLGVDESTIWGDHYFVEALKKK